MVDYVVSKSCEHLSRFLVMVPWRAVMSTKSEIGLGFDIKG